METRARRLLAIVNHAYGANWEIAGAIKESAETFGAVTHSELHRSLAGQRLKHKLTNDNIAIPIPGAADVRSNT